LKGEKNVPKEARGGKETAAEIEKFQTKLRGPGEGKENLGNPRWRKVYRVND